MVAEIDEGTACLDCGEACEGFTPHEWKYVLFLGFNIILLFFLLIYRNICNNCRCPRECHDLRFKGYVTAGEKLLLDSLTVDKLRLNESDKYSTLEKGFTWQPAGLNYKEVF